MQIRRKKEKIIIGRKHTFLFVFDGADIFVQIFGTSLVDLVDFLHAKL